MAHDEHDHDHDAQHDHGDLAFVRTRVDDEMLTRLDETHAALAETLRLARRFGELTDEEKEALVAAQKRVEDHAAWTPGYHAAGDRCAACGGDVEPLFHDELSEGELPYAAYLSGVPVHPDEKCLADFAAAVPDLSPRGVDKARRRFTTDLTRPSPSLAMFFRHDLLAQAPFDLTSWANSVAAANTDMSRALRNDIERLLQWVHARLFH